MASTTSRTMIAALQISLDGFMQGPHGEKDWVDSWADAIQLIPDVDTFVLGGHMYPGYGEYWESIYANPDRVPPFQERIPSKGEVEYARLAAQDTPHRFVLDAGARLVAGSKNHQRRCGAANPQESAGEECVCGRRGDPRRKPSERGPR